jgi:uncharacterized protein (TIGR03435 family)
MVSIALNSTRSRFLIAFVVAVIPHNGMSQATANKTLKDKPLQFDVVSIRPDNSAGGRSASHSDGYSATLPLRVFVAVAYDIQGDNLVTGGPGWVDSARYSIDAKVDGSDLDAYHKLSGKQRDAMLQSILADRFKLKAHIKAKELPIYELVVAKGGPKLRETKPDDADDNDVKGPDRISQARPITIRSGLFRGHAVGMSDLVDGILPRELRRIVVDKTGLTGRYDISLKWTPDQGPAPMLNGEPDTSAPSIFTALEEQLGLKLNSTKGPVDTLVIDHIELPSEN